MKKAIITGVNGQDGSYLAELLLEKGYDVHGLIRRSSEMKFERIKHLIKDPQLDDGENRFHLHYNDLTDSLNITKLIQTIQPDEIYNLAAQSHVRISFDTPEYTSNTNSLGTLRILESIKLLGLEKKIRFYQASTSELFGLPLEVPQSETTPFHPRSPYAVSKLFAYWITINYREAYGIFACNGILFNHESPRRSKNFVTRKITIMASEIALGMRDCLYLGNMYAKRDWGYAKEYVEAMWKMLQMDEPDEFVVATGETHTVKEFVDFVFKALDIDLRWEGEGVDEVAFSSKTGEIVIRIDPYYFRPTEVELLLGNPQKAKEKLHWEPKVKFEELAKIMVEYDYNRLKNLK
jgi:GDPmannose 4,6-dehydratase